MALSIEKVITIKVTDVNEAPTSITLDKDTVEENAKAGTVVGRLTGMDPEGDKLTFALAEDDDTVDNDDNRGAGCGHEPNVNRALGGY